MALFGAVVVVVEEELTAATAVNILHSFQGAAAAAELGNMQEVAEAQVDHLAH
jgi:hypothetical protein